MEMIRPCWRINPCHSSINSNHDNNGLNRGCSSDQRQRPAKSPRNKTTPNEVHGKFFLSVLRSQNPCPVPEEYSVGQKPLQDRGPADDLEHRVRSFCRCTPAVRRWRRQLEGIWPFVGSQSNTRAVWGRTNCGQFRAFGPLQPAVVAKRSLSITIGTSRRPVPPPCVQRSFRLRGEFRRHV